MATNKDIYHTVSGGIYNISGNSSVYVVGILVYADLECALIW